ncbi:hypothetical protein [Actinomadura roseirufa]|uniref:hypothetical protein n=1 Tax=Actinomadura roseirufa TaxID=2094049 RepID=UPI001040E56D|nr:hypothetical protein [Actinomadura roseirufa]
MGLQRGPEPFQRVYSAPEPPAPARRPRRVALAVALATFVVAGVVVFLLLPGGGEEHAARRPRASASASDAPTSDDPSGPPAARPVTALPAPCAMVTQGTLGRIVPAAKREGGGGNSTLTTCTYTSSAPGSRSLRVEAHLHPPGASADPVKDAEGYFDAHWTQAHDPDLERTISLEKETGIGDEAYRWLKADKGLPTIIGQVTVRLRNVVVTVSYSEETPAKGAGEDRRRACLAMAGTAAREVLRALG